MPASCSRCPDDSARSIRTGCAPRQGPRADGLLGGVLCYTVGAGSLPTRDGDWDRFKPFRQVPHIWDAPDRTRSIDVDGDGRADLLFAAPSGLLVFRSDGRDGWLAPERVAYHAREADGPVLLFANSHHSLMLADMTGDGLVDLVRVQHHRVDYWPNLGHGRFGRRRTMASAPLLDRPDRFDARRVRLADVDGAGPADLIYVGPDRVRWWANQSGNAYGAEQIVIGVSGVADPMAVSIADLRGDGTACLVWASTSLRDQLAPLRYVRLMQAGKPYLLASMDNHLGRTTTSATPRALPSTWPTAARARPGPRACRSRSSA